MIETASTGLFLLLRLIAAHMAADFVFQPISWVKERREKHWRSPRLYLHGAVVAGIGYLFAGIWTSLWLLAVLFATHVAIDGLKSKRADRALTLVFDQGAHLAVLVFCWWLLMRGQPVPLASWIHSLFSDLRVWILVVCYVAVLWPAGVLVGKLTEPYRGQLTRASSGAAESRESLENAGLLIGRLERLLIVTFVLLGRFEAIGFLIAAKSIFRFGDIHSPGDRKEAEYILIGTLLSFVIAIGTGLLARWLLGCVDSMSVTGTT